MCLLSRYACQDHRRGSCFEKEPFGCLGSICKCIKIPYIWDMLSSLNNLCIHSMLNLISADSSAIALQLLNRVNTWGVGTLKWSIIHMCLGKFNWVPVVAFCCWNRHNNILFLFFCVFFLTTPLRHCHKEKSIADMRQWWVSTYTEILKSYNFKNAITFHFMVHLV